MTSIHEFATLGDQLDVLTSELRLDNLKPTQIFAYQLRSLVGSVDQKCFVQTSQKNASSIRLHACELRQRTVMRLIFPSGRPTSDAARLPRRATKSALRPVDRIFKYTQPSSCTSETLAWGLIYLHYNWCIVLHRSPSAALAFLERCCDAESTSTPSKIRRARSRRCTQSPFAFF